MQPSEAVTNSQHFPRVAIVVLNWRQVEDTLACLESLRSLDYPSYHVVVVDNGSADGSAERIRDRFADVTLIENARNLGFAGGNNIGINHAIRGDADYVLLLNSDTVVSPDLLQELVKVAESDQRIGMLGPTIYYHHKSNVIWSAGGTLSRYGEPGHLRVNEVDEVPGEAIRDVDYVTGCAIMVKRSVIEQVGLLDERFFIYFEEAEWCSRARHAGFRVIYVPRARMWHKIQMDARNQSRRYLYFMARNRLLYLRCGGARPWVIFVASLDLLRTAASWRLRPRHRDLRPLSGAVVHGVGDFLRGRFGEPPMSV
jgi:GT2 family glycosyltransferase